ncbi:Dynein regulatory complex subunit 6 [Lamellibrachia satsuma]|nr:Dynein regulatory complex subunit 6 [Lamellibrachia satsuma]
MAAASLKGIDKGLKDYLKRHQLPEVYEALLSGLAVMCPSDPYQFILDRLVLGIIPNMKDDDVGEPVIEGLHWDMFIDEDMKPKKKLISESNLEYIFNFDEDTQPTAEMLEVAYNHFNMKLMRLCFNNWLRYHLTKVEKNKEMDVKMTEAEEYYRRRLMRANMLRWITWLQNRKERQAVAYDKLHHISNTMMGRVIFRAWHGVTQEAKRTREYFEKLERGEETGDSEDGSFWKAGSDVRDDISMLPRKVALKIFGELDITDLARCACVCRSWKVLTQSNTLWSKLDLTKAFRKVNNRVLSSLLAKCRPYLVHLNLRGCHLITETAFMNIRQCRNLQDLNLSGLEVVNDDTIKVIADGCTILLFLNISDTMITDASLRTIAMNLTNLQYLSLAYCQHITDKGIAYLSHGKGAKRLVYLDLSGCVQLTAGAYMALSSGCQRMQSLILNDISNLDDECIEDFTQNCSTLRHVSLLGSHNLTDLAFKALASNKKLAKIKIESNQLISDAAFKQFGRSCQDLFHLYMVDCPRITDQTLRSLISCKFLTVVNLADCVKVTDSGLRALLEAQCGCKIQELNLTNCVRLTDMTVVTINKRCSNLVYLTICFCDHITEAGIELLGQTTCITSLDISGCHCSDQGLSSLGNNFRLKDLNLSECTSITDLGLQKFAQQCREIERLDISHCMQLTDSAIKNLAFNCKMLSYLNLAGCKLLTDLSIQYLCGVCHYLAYLDISGSLHISYIVKVLQNAIEEKNEPIKHLESQIEDLEQYTRMDDVIISGLETKHQTYAEATSTSTTVETDTDAPHKETSTLEDKVVNFLKMKHINVNCNDISACHTLGSNKKTSTAANRTPHALSSLTATNRTPPRIIITHSNQPYTPSHHHPQQPTVCPMHHHHPQQPTICPHVSYHHPQQPTVRPHASSSPTETKRTPPHIIITHSNQPYTPTHHHHPQLQPYAPRIIITHSYNHTPHASSSPTATNSTPPHIIITHSNQPYAPTHYHHPQQPTVLPHASSSPTATNRMPPRIIITHSNQPYSPTHHHHPQQSGELSEDETHQRQL